MLLFAISSRQCLVDLNKVRPTFNIRLYTSGGPLDTV